MTNYEIFKWIAVSLSFISLISALIFIIFFCCFRTISSNLSLRLTLCVQICDAFFALGIILVATPIKENPIYCKLQAFLLQFGALCSVLARLALTIILYLVVKQYQFLDDMLETYVFLAVGIISLLISAIPFITGDIGISGEWCWVASEENISWGVQKCVVSFFSFFVEVWISIFAMLILSYFISKNLRIFVGNKQVISLRKRVKYYPLALIVCWLMPTVNRIFTALGRKNELLSILHIVSFSFQGFLNFLLFGYGFSKKVYKEKWLKKDKKKKFNFEMWVFMKKIVYFIIIVKKQYH